MQCVDSLRYNIKAIGLELEAKDKILIEEKIVSTIGKYFDDPSTIVDVNVRDINGPKGGIDKEVDVVITIKGDKNPIKIAERDARVAEAINKVSDRVEKTLRRHKDKIIESGRHPRKYYIDKKLSEK